MEKKIYDISLPLTVHTKVFPGDTPLQYNYMKYIETGDGLTLSEFSATAHIGTHVDAPMHYCEGGQAVGGLGLGIFAGECQVIKLDTSLTAPVKPEELSTYSDLPSRVLLCTTVENNYKHWTDGYRALSVDLIDYLHSKGVKLIGTDTPSVDAFDSTDALVHKRIFSYNMVIIENLYLDEVTEDRYELIALPLKFMELEASPVRAILRTL